MGSLPHEKIIQVPTSFSYTDTHNIVLELSGTLQTSIWDDTGNADL